MLSPRTTRTLLQRQRGAAFIVMLVILIVGVAAFLVSALSKVALQTERNNQSSDLLSHAKEVIIGYALNGTGGGQRPGDLPYPDKLLGTETPPNYDGNTDSCTPLQAAPTPSGCLGRYPWLTLGMSIASPSENDPTGVMPWYAVSANLVDPAGVTLNSELLNNAPHTWLTVRDMNGNVLSNRVAFVIMIPGVVLPGQSRPVSPNLGGANQYLDSITVPATCTAPCVPGTYSNADADDDFIMGAEHRWIDDPANPGKQTEDTSYNFNDKLLYVTIDDLMPLIEKRIAREVKSCLDNYAALSANKYPWPAPSSDVVTYLSMNGTRFGRIPSQPTVNTSTPLSSSNASDTKIQALYAAMDALNTAVNNCVASGSASNETALAAAGALLVTAANTVASNQPTTPAISTTTTNSAISAGTKAQSILAPSRCSRINSGTSTTVQTNLNNTYTALGSINVTVPEDTSMQISWPAGCFVGGTYWDEWKNLVFYQVADGFQPLSAGATCVACMSISGSGNTAAGSGIYRAAVIVAGQMLGGQNPRNQTASPPTTYLEGVNPHNATAPATTFETYKVTDPSYSTVNDLVMCVDGRNNCQ